MSTKHPDDLLAPPGAAGSPARDRADAAKRLHALTRRELEVLALLSTGASAQAIGHQLGIKLPTVKRHLRNLYRKLTATNRVQATRCYLLARPRATVADVPKRAQPGR